MVLSSEQIKIIQSAPPSAFTWGAFGKGLLTAAFWGGFNIIPQYLIKDEKNELPKPTFSDWIFEILQILLWISFFYLLWKLYKNNWSFKKTFN